MKIRLSELREYLRGSLWFLPTVCVALSMGLAFAISAADRRLGTPRWPALVFSGSADSARDILSTIAASMITFIGLVFTITIVVLQLASSQFSPRVLRTFLRDRDSQIALGVFVGTFVYAFLLLREVRSAPTGDFVPSVGITLAFAFVLLSLGVFIRYIDHVAHSIQASNIIGSVGDETLELIDRIYPEGPDDTPAPEPSGPPVSILPSSHPSAKLTDFDAGALVRTAHRTGRTLVLVPSVGDFVPTGAPLFEIHGSGEDPGDLTHHLSFGLERTMRQDVAFGFRQVIDIAERALSPSTNDPTTAVQVIDQLHDFLRRLGPRRFPHGVHRDHDGVPRLFVPTMSWEDYVHLATDEIRHYGEGSIQVVRRLRAMLEDLLTVVPDDRRGPVREQLRLLDRMVERSFPDEADRVRGGQPDEQGVGD